MNTRRVDFAIVGFPKCGTTALVRELGKSDRVNIGRWKGNLEVDVTAHSDEELPIEFWSDDKVNGHKFSAYIYSKTKLHALSTLSPHGRFILCVRNPLLSLISWHRMHMNIANLSSSNHFAWVHRDFYGRCTLEEYYHEFAKDRLQYDAYFKGMLTVVPAEQVLVVWQSKMAENMPAVIKVCGEFLGIPMHNPVARPPHVGFADQSRMIVPGEIEAQLEQVETHLRELIRSCGVYEVS